MKENYLIKKLKSCVGDWDGAFNIVAKQTGHYREYRYFSVIVAHNFLSGDHEFTARVDGNGNCEMDFHEDSWHPITMGNLFAFMWFETATVRPSA